MVAKTYPSRPTTSIDPRRLLTRGPEALFGCSGGEPFAKRRDRLPIAGPLGIEWSQKLAQREGIFTGVSGGAIYGKSDRYAAFPESNPVTPEDIAATIYDLMGLDPGMEITDRLDRTVHLSDGAAIREIYS